MVFVVSRYVYGTMVAHITVSYILFTFMHVLAETEKKSSYSKQSVIVSRYISSHLCILAGREKHISDNKQLCINLCLANWKRKLIIIFLFSDL